MKQRVATVMILIRVDAGIKLSLLNWRDSGNESVLVVKGDGLGFPRSLNM